MARESSRPEVRETYCSGPGSGGQLGADIDGICGEQKLAICTDALAHVPARRVSKSRPDQRQRGGRGRFGGESGGLVAGAARKMQGLSVCQGGMAEALSLSVVGQSRGSIIAATAAGEIPSTKKV